MTRSSLLLFATLFACSATRRAFAAPLEDLVDYLPSFGRPPSTMFSGYLDASDGCDKQSNGEYCKVHYWLALADCVDPLDAPVVLWLNGGPGSSSILGFLQENGPLLINATGGLMENPWSWTKAPANLLAIEAPVGVGYSYCEVQKERNEPCTNTDSFTASASRAALVDFFTNKFPELGNSDFFITGESYAGVYIPTLSKEILDNAADVVPLKGVAVGDPCTDNTAQADSMDSLWYAHKYGMVDDDIFDTLWNKCEARHPNLMTRGGKHLVAQQLNKQLKEQRQRRRRMTEDEHKVHARDLFMRTVLSGGPNMHQTDECRLAYRKFLLSSSDGLSQGWRDLYIDDYSLFSPVSNKEDEDMATYMMRSDVRKALHVEEAPTKTWPYADQGFDYTKEYDACNPDVSIHVSMIDIYREIAPKLQTTFVYNGDTDPCVSYEGTRTAIKRIGFNEIDGGSYRPWFFNQTATTAEVLIEKAPLFGPALLVQDMGAQTGGYVTSYEHGLSFVLIHGSGHMVPQFQPISSLHFLRALLSGRDLSPPLSSNGTISGMSEDDFESYEDEWTDMAKSDLFINW